MERQLISGLELDLTERPISLFSPPVRLLLEEFARAANTLAFGYPTHDGTKPTVCVFYSSQREITTLELELTEPPNKWSLYRGEYPNEEDLQKGLESRDIEVGKRIVIWRWVDPAD